MTLEKKAFWRRDSFGGYVGSDGFAGFCLLRFFSAGFAGLVVFCLLRFFSAGFTGLVGFYLLLLFFSIFAAFDYLCCFR